MKYNEEMLQYNPSNQKFDDSLFEDEPSQMDDSLFEDTPVQKNVFDTSSLNDLEKNRVGAIRGLLQGATAGFGDELAAGIDVGLEKLKGNEDSISNLYTKYRDKYREANKKAEEEAPISYFAGNVGGGVLPGVVTGGSSAAATLASSGLKAAAPKLLASGAAQGALDTLGRSESTELEDLAKEAGLGAGLGAAAAIGVPSLVKGVSNVPSLTKQAASKFLDVVEPNMSKRIGESYNLGKRGLDVVGDKAEETLKSDTLRVANEMKNTLKGKFDNASKRLGQILEEASEGKNHTTFVQELENELANNDSISNDVRNYTLREINKLKKGPTTQLVSGQEQAQTKLERMMERARGKNELLGEEGFVMQVDPTDEGNFLQGINARLNQSGDAEKSRQVLQTMIPEDKLVKIKNNDFKDLSLSELNSLKSELNSAAASVKANNPLQAKEFTEQARLISDYIDSNLDQGLATEAKFLNREMKDIHDLGKLDSSLSRVNQFDPNVDLNMQKVINTSDTNKLDRVKQLGGLGSNLSQNIDDIRLRNELLKDASRETQGVFDATRRLTKGTAMRASNYAGKVKKVMDDQVAKSRLIQKAQALGDTKIVKLLSTPVTAENRSKLMFSLSQQPVFRNLIDEEEVEE